MSDDFSFDFSGDDKVKGGSIPPNTLLTVTAVEQQSENLRAGEKVIGRYLRAGVSPNAGKKYMGIRFQVSAADKEEYLGRPVDSTLWVDPTEAKFRAQVEKITGQPLPRAGEESHVRMSPADIAEALAEFSFQVKVGPGKNGYTEVKYYNDRVERVEVPRTEISGGSGGAASGGGDDFDDWGADGDDDEF